LKFPRTPGKAPQADGSNGPSAVHSRRRHWH
jgi:hypothetical protein